MCIPAVEQVEHDATQRRPEATAADAKRNTLGSNRCGQHLRGDWREGVVEAECGQEGGNLRDGANGLEQTPRRREQRLQPRMDEPCLRRLGRRKGGSGT